MPDLSSLTAIARSRASAPCREAHYRLVPGSRVLDLGCGRGADVTALVRWGFAAEGWDPAHRPDRPEGLFDAVLCIYVLHVLAPELRPSVVDDALSFLRPGGLLFLATRTPAEMGPLGARRGWNRRHDGFITSRGTFQGAMTAQDLQALLKDRPVDVVQAKTGRFAWLLASKLGD